MTAAFREGHEGSRGRRPRPQRRKQHNPVQVQRGVLAERQMRIVKMEGTGHPLEWMLFKITSEGIELL